MTRSELTLKLAEANPHLHTRDLEKIVNGVFQTIADALAEGRRVELRGFGAFSTKDRNARLGRNPRTGEKVPVSEKKVPFFKAGKQLKELLNSETGE